MVFKGRIVSIIFKFKQFALTNIRHETRMYTNNNEYVDNSWSVWEKNGKFLNFPVIFHPFNTFGGHFVYVFEMLAIMDNAMSLFVNEWKVKGAKNTHSYANFSPSHEWIAVMDSAVK